MKHKLLKKKAIQVFVSGRKDEIKAGKTMLWSQDECHQCWGDCCGYVWSLRNTRAEIPIGNQRKRQTWYGALDLFSGRCFFQKVKPSKTADSQETIRFLKRLLEHYPTQQHIILWDGASYHCSDEVKDFLKEVNAGLDKKDWRIHCIRFAPNAPEQNPIEDVWLQAKEFVRKHFDRIKSFSNAIGLFEQFLSEKIFKFTKMKCYFNS